MNVRFSHIPFGRLVDWAEGTLSTAEQEQIAGHVHSCTHCQQTLADAQRLITLMQTDQALDPPPTVVERALRIYQPRTRTPATSLLQRLVATLQFDSFQATPALGLRSEGATVQQLLYATDEYDIDLRLTKAEADNAWQLSGQLLGDGMDNSDVANSDHGNVEGQVTLTNEEEQIQAPLTALNEFVLPAVPPGAYSLVVRVGNTEITIASLQLGS